MGILDKRKTFKPFDYPWAYDAYKTHEEMHWLPNEATNLPDDINDFKNKLTDDERYLTTQILRFFTQGDVDVSAAYAKVYLPKFHKPELLMSMTSFAAREAVHIDAYSQVVETLGFGDEEYNKFMEYQAMRNKHDILWDEPWKIDYKTIKQDSNFYQQTKWIPNDIVSGGRDAGFTDEKIEEIFNLAYSLAKFSGFVEGLQLFSTFAILLNLKRHGLMKGMGSIVTWSIRDESLHVETMSKVFLEMMKDFPWLNTPSFQELIHSLAYKMVELEDAFVDLAFTDQGREVQLKNLTKQEIKDFVRVTCNERLQMLGMTPLFDNRENPLPWFNIMVAGDEHANFFEGRGTAYAKGMDTGSINFNKMEDMFENLTNLESEKYAELDQE